MTLNKIPLKDSPDFTVVHTDSLTEYIIPEKVEKEMDARYVGEFTLRAKNGQWANTPVQLYYQKEKYKDHNGEHSNYFGLFFRDGKLLITDAISAVQDKDGEPVVYSGVLDEKNREVLYSAYVHDYQRRGDLMMDGGREYGRSSLHPYVHFYIKDGELMKHDIPSTE